MMQDFLKAQINKKVAAVGNGRRLHPSMESEIMGALNAALTEEEIAAIVVTLESDEKIDRLLFTAAGGQCLMVEIKH